MSATAGPSTASATLRGGFLAAIFLMATSAIGPGFITQTTSFTVQLGAAFAFVLSGLPSGSISDPSYLLVFVAAAVALTAAAWIGYEGVLVASIVLVLLGTAFGLRHQRRHQRLQAQDRRVALVAHPQPEIRRHLVVAASRRVQPAGGLADQLLQPRLDVHVDVLERGREGEPPALDF